MPQYSYTYPEGLAGQVGTYATGRVISLTNPLNAQLTNYDVDGTTTNGTYGVSATNGQQTVSAEFVASSLTAAQIAAGVAAAINADPSFAGVIQSATVVNTDQVDILFQAAGMIWTVTTSGPAGPDITTTTAAGYSQVNPGIILQADGSGGFTTAYSDPSISFGVVVKNADLVHPLTGAVSATGFSGPAELSLVSMGEIYVQVASGVTVSKGNQAYFNGTTGTWSNASAGSHVLVPESMWMTGGSGVQRVFVNLPSET